MKKFYFISLILFMALLVFAMIMIGCVACFFDIGSLVMVAGGTFIMLLSGYSPREMGRHFKSGLTRGPVPETELKQGIVFFKALQKYLLLSGGIGMMMGLIGLLAALDDPNKIGQGMALALITVLYAVFLSMAVAVPFRTGLEKKLEQAN